MKNIMALGIVLLLGINAYAHEAPKHEHAQLIPIPPYNLPFGEAGAKAALAASEALLGSFDEEMRSKFIFDLHAPERANWSNLPAGIVDRTGISVAEMSDEQRAHLFAFLSSSLGEEGYESVMEVMAAEAFLSSDERAERLKWDPQNYWISFFGTPSAAAPWGWQFGGHHLALNLSVENNRVETMSPSFVGTEPAIFTLNGVDYEAVLDMHRAGFAVYSALDEAQQIKADAGDIPEDVLAGPGNDGVLPPMIGLYSAEMTAEQKTLLLAAINEWLSIQPDENASRRMAMIEGDLDDISFAWRGNDQVNTPTYMRIQGPDLIIELLSTGGNIGQSASGQGHYHTIYRVPSMEYGG